MERWLKGNSGNPRGRLRSGTAIADLARSQVHKHQLIEMLGSIAAGDKDHADVEVDQQLRAIQLLLVYGYGPPRTEVEAREALLIQVNYVERNQIAITGTAPGTAAGDPGCQAVQRGLLRTSLGKNGSGNGSSDPPSA